MQRNTQNAFIYTAGTICVAAFSVGVLGWTFNELQKRPEASPLQPAQPTQPIKPQTGQKQTQTPWGVGNMLQPPSSLAP